MRTKYSSKLKTAIHNLMSSADEIKLREIRIENWATFFAFPISLWAINVQDFLLINKEAVNGVSITTWGFISFGLGAGLTLWLIQPKVIDVLTRISAIYTFLCLLLWISLPELNFLSVLMLFGIGTCVSISSYAFVFVSNNAEKFYGCLLMLVMIDIIEIMEAYNLNGQCVSKLISFGFIALLCLCIYTCSTLGLLQTVDKSSNISIKKQCVPKNARYSILLSLYVLLAYFVIRITGFHAPAFQHPPGSGSISIMVLMTILFSVGIFAILRKSTWTLCNLFFLTAVLSHLAWYMKLELLAYYFSELKEIWLLIAFYLIGCVTNKFCDEKTHKILISFTILLVSMVYIFIELILKADDAQWVATVSSSLLFMIFLMMSPVFSQYLFFADWSYEFKRIHMNRNNTKEGDDTGGDQTTSFHKDDLPNRYTLLDETRLTPREKQVVILLLRGMTLRQIAPELGLTFSTVATYSKNIYKKLNINSRAELFFLFGYAQDRDN